MWFLITWKIKSENNDIILNKSAHTKKQYLSSNNLLWNSLKNKIWFFDLPKALPFRSFKFFHSIGICTGLGWLYTLFPKIVRPQFASYYFFLCCCCCWRRRKLEKKIEKKQEKKQKKKNERKGRKRKIFFFFNYVRKLCQKIKQTKICKKNIFFSNENIQSPHRKVVHHLYNQTILHFDAMVYLRVDINQLQIAWK